MTAFPAGPAGGADDLVLAFLGGMSAADARRRFQLGLVGDDPNYVVLDIRPALERDKQEFAHARVALLAPTNAAGLPAYMPYDVWKRLPGGDTEVWKVRGHAANAGGVTAEQFEYKPVAGWTLQQAPAAPPR